MKNVVRDLVRRMIGNDAAGDALADVCSRCVAAVDEGDVCLRVEDASARERLKGERRLVSIAPDESRPFVLSGDRLYTRRNWCYEQTVKSRIREMASVADGETVDVPESGDFAKLSDEQRTAVSAMSGSRFSVLTGGPGTGKTFTFALAVRLARETQKDLRLSLAAPTGKAAARMTESLGKGVADGCTATTLHKLLRPNRDFVTFKHNRENPLGADWVIVDEASMIDLPMMAKLLDALPSGCRLTLVGDEHQLASVERGRVFGDLCQFPGVQVSRLTISRRFQHGGEIAVLSDAVNGGDEERAMATLQKGGELVQYRDIAAFGPFSPEGWADFLPVIRDRYAAFSGAQTSEAALEHLNDFRVLCAVRSGPYGVECLNDFIWRRLAAKGRCPIPVMITRNDRSLGVANGDVGVIMPNDPKNLHLPTETGVRSVRIELLDSTEMAFATTIHKSQGSEFTDVAVVLPPEGDNPLLTREILYTGITRTKRSVFVYASEKSVRKCCQRTVERLSGLIG